MHIYVDESGLFLPLDGQKSKMSSIGALAIPSSRHDALLSEFDVVRARWGMRDSEVKGSRLTAARVAELIDLLSAFDVVFEACSIDAAVHTNDEVSLHKEGQAAKLMADITREHHPNLIQQLHQMQEELLELPNQLYIQFIVIIILIERALATFTMYYSQRKPEELASFHWTVDAKDTSLTPSERIWTTLILPVMQTNSLTKPHPMVEWGDYSRFARFEVGDATVLKRLLPKPARKKLRRPRPIDLKKILREDFQFGDSRSSPGLQLVDVLVNTLTRALNENLLPSGWRHIGRLMIRTMPQSVHFVSLGHAAEARGSGTATSRFRRRVSDRIDAEAKSMIKVPEGFRPKFP
jgi:hypothetical protein